MASPSTLEPETDSNSGMTVPDGLGRCWSLWHLASLDAPTVAVCWCLAFAWAVHVRLPLWLPTVLFLSTWGFYIADRLMDARRYYQGPYASAAEELRPRHHFHWRHSRIFLPLAVVAGLVALSLVLHSMPPSARARNSILAVAAIAYFTSVHSPLTASRTRWRLRPPKELLVGVLFTLACVTPAWARSAAGGGSLTLPALVFAALAWLNCSAIESWEAQSDALQRFRVGVWALVLAGTGLLAAIGAAVIDIPRIALLLTAATASAVLLAALDRIRKSLSATALRAAADLVLLTPLAVLMLP